MVSPVKSFARSASYLLSRRVAHPLWDLKDGSVRLDALRKLEKSQWQTRAALEQVQRDRLAQILAHAQSNCDFYRDRFAACGFDAAQPFDPRAFRRVPLLTKVDVREKVQQLIARPYVREQLPFHKTGGSTGVSLTTYFDQSWREVRTADALRANQWAGYFHGMKVAAVWGNPPVAVTFKERVRSAFYDRHIYLDTMNLTDATMGSFARECRRELPDVVFGHSHSIYIFASYLLKAGITDIRPRGIVATSMMLLPNERAVIEQAFGCKVTDRYGCEEVGLIASECEQHAGYHLNIEHLYIEFLGSDGEPVQPGEEGTVVVTDLLNRAMPLIRYRVEDVGVPSARNCPCGRGMPLMERITGRVADYLKRSDGSLVAGVSLIERTLTAIPGIEQMQIVQERLDELLLRVVKAPDYRADSERQLRSEFAQVFGAGTTLRIEEVSRIAQEANGKFRFSICRI